MRSIGEGGFRATGVDSIPNDYLMQSSSRLIYLCSSLFILLCCKEAVTSGHVIGVVE